MHKINAHSPSLHLSNSDLFQHVRLNGRDKLTRYKRIYDRHVHFDGRIARTWRLGALNAIHGHSDTSQPTCGDDRVPQQLRNWIEQVESQGLPNTATRQAGRKGTFQWQCASVPVSLALDERHEGSRAVRVVWANPWWCPASKSR